MTASELPQSFLDFLKTIKGKRSRIVVQHILEHGFITTEELEVQYGYKHPPRAVRDVREQGVPIETFTVLNSQGKPIAAYRFGNWPEERHGRSGGRRVISKSLKKSLFEMQRGRCAICLEQYDQRYLQVDHRVPYMVAGDMDSHDDQTAYMLVCGSCNRAKSWSCEHCDNGQRLKDASICLRCYWASPSLYEHVAMRPIRRLDLVWSEDEVSEYDVLKRLADSTGDHLPDHVKAVLKKYVTEGR